MVVDSGVPGIRFADARGARIAYQDLGVHPNGVTIVGVPPLAQNIETAWGWPTVRLMLQRLSSIGRYLHYDKRGTGASDHNGPLPGIDERVDDLRAVFDAADIEHAYLFAQSGGGPGALMFAATYPERVDGVILHNSGAVLRPDDVTSEMLAAARERQRVFADLWGTDDSITIDLFAPSLADDLEFRAWHATYERSAASKAALLELFHINEELDARGVLDDLEVPVLVIHCVGDQRVPIEYGRQVAAAVPDAEIVELDYEDHYAYAIPLDEWIPAIEHFVGGSPTRRGDAPATTSHPDASPSGGRRDAPPTVRIVTLGRFAVEVDGVEVAPSAWGGRRARQLCKRLIVARGRPVPRLELIDLLWPDETDERALSARLSVQLSAVRKVLRCGVAATRESVALLTDEVTVDIEQLLPATDDRAVLALYRGEFCPDDRFDDWTVAVRDEAHQKFVASARRLVDRYAAFDQHQLAADVARRIVEADRYDLGAHELLIAALERCAAEPVIARARAAYAEVLAELE